MCWPWVPWRARPRHCFSPASSTRRAGSRFRRSSDPTRRTSPTATSDASGCLRSWMLSRGEPRAPRRGLGRRWPSRASTSKQTHGWRHWRTWGWPWRCVATGRLDEAEREALRGERLRRSPHPTVGHAHALLVLAQVRVARSRLARAQGDLQHARRAIVGFSGSGTAAGDRRHCRAGPRRGSSCRGQPRTCRRTQSGRTRRTARPRSRSLPTRDRRTALHLAEYGQEPHARAVPQTRGKIAELRRSPAPKRSGCSTPLNHPGDPRPTRFKSPPASGMLEPACRPLTIASSTKESSEHAMPLHLSE